MRGAALVDGPPREVLVVVTRRIGDVLLATPLIRSLRAAWPDTAVDALVFAGTEGVLAGNPDIRRVVTVPERPTAGAHLALLRSLRRRYALALSLVPGDRPTLYAFVAGRRRAGLLVPGRKNAWKQRLLQAWAPFDDLNTHTVRMHLALAGLLGIPPIADVIPSWHPQDEAQVDAMLTPADRPIAVLHAYPKYRYKMWPADRWTALGCTLTEHGYRVVLTGSPDAREVEYLRELAEGLPPDSLNAAGRLTLGGSVCLVSRAALFIGADTAMTHAAAALGVPTVALFGPSNPVKWGPWPRGHTAAANPWHRCGTQRVGNVVLLQGVQACVPCLLEGCDRHIESNSDCLLTLPTAKVLRAVDALVLGQRG